MVPPSCLQLRLFRHPLHRATSTGNSFADPAEYAIVVAVLAASAAMDVLFDWFELVRNYFRSFLLPNAVTEVKADAEAVYALLNDQDIVEVLTTPTPAVEAAVESVLAHESASNAAEWSYTLPEVTPPPIDEYLEALAQWYLDQFNALRDFVLSIDLNEIDSCTLITVAAIVIFALLGLFYLLYYFRLSSPARIYSQHIPGSATQLPPKSVQIDTTSGGVGAVFNTVALKDGAFRQFLEQPYRPTAWMSFPWLSGHLQTFYTARASPAWLNTPFITYKREIIPVEALSPNLLPGEVALDWGVLGLARGNTIEVQEYHKSFTETTPTVLICHGLAGGGSEHYVKNFIYHLSTTYGWRCVVFNARGCGGSTLINQQLYCGAYTQDLRQVVASIHARLPHSPLLAVGFSLGANILTKFAGEEGLVGNPPPFTALASLANPFDFLLGARHLDSSWFMRTVYSANLAKNLIRLFRWHFDKLQESDKKNGIARPSPEYDLNEVYSSPSLREFDKRLTRIVFGYATVDDYYRDASSSRFVKFLRVPSLLLSALDDPISTRTAIPYDEASINPYVILVTTKAGGHSMDWYQDNWKVSSWSAQAVGKFFSSILENVNPPKSGSKIATPPPHLHEKQAEATQLQEDSSPETLSWATAGQMPPSNAEITLEESVQFAMEVQAKLESLEQELNGNGVLHPDTDAAE